jgi:hypothetical protein
LYNHYAAEHRHPANRALHVVGIPLVVLSLAAIASPWRPFGWSRTHALIALAVGSALLVAGHIIEGNRPTVMSNPSAALTSLVWWIRRFTRKPRDA